MSSLQKEQVWMICIISLALGIGAIASEASYRTQDRNKSALVPITAAQNPTPAVFHITAPPTLDPNRQPTPKPTPKPTQNIYPQSEQTLEPIVFGDRNQRVRDLQSSLNKLGYSAGTVDGIFGKNTQSAVKQFQKRNGIKPTGDADHYTLTRINALIEKSEKPSFFESVISVFDSFEETVKSINDLAGALPTQEPYVWIPQTGHCYHESFECCGMIEPDYVKLSSAIRRGYDKCSVCY